VAILGAAPAHRHSAEGDERGGEDNRQIGDQWHWRKEFPSLTALTAEKPRLEDIARERRLPF